MTVIQIVREELSIEVQYLLSAVGLVGGHVGGRLGLFRRFV